MDMGGSNLAVQEEFQFSVTGSPESYDPSLIWNISEVEVTPTVPEDERSALSADYNIEHTQEKKNMDTLPRTSRVIFIQFRLS